MLYAHLVSPFVQSSGTIRNSVATFKCIYDGRMSLPALELLERTDVRVLVV